MCLNEKIHRISRAKAGKLGGRLQAELRFAARVSTQENGKYDALLEKITEDIVNRVEVEDYIPDSIVKDIEEQLMTIQKSAKAYKLHCISHAHIDMNWMWGFQETSNIVLDTFRTMLRLMDEYPTFTYSQSQASTYKMCQEYDPELFEQIVRRVREGRWEVAATTWTEADKNIPSGESLTRHHLYTKDYCMKTFGLTDEQLQIDFEPDTFGHSANVPEILNAGGVKYYYHCRGQKLEYAYRYRAPGGGEILCYQDPFFYNHAIDQNIFEHLPEIQSRRGIKVGICVYGVGDHGGGPTRRDIEKIIDMQSWPIAPTIVFSSYAKFFSELEAYRDLLPVIDTERNYIFTGCYSSQSRIKGANRLSEDRLCCAEAMTALAGCYADGTSYSGNYKKAWQKVLFNQFHDILPGSCIRDTREHALGEFQQALGFANAGLTKGMLTIAQAIDSSSIEADEDLLSASEGAGVGFISGIGDRALHTVAEYGRGKTRILHVFNPTAYDRKEIVTLTIWDWMGDPALLEVTDVKGEVCTAVVGSKNGYWGHEFINITLRAEVESYGYTTFVIREKERTELSLTARYEEGGRCDSYIPNILENDLIKAVFDDNMCLVSLIDKKTGKTFINEKAGYFDYFEENGRIPMPNAWSEGPAIYRCNLNEEGRVYVNGKDYNRTARQTIAYTIEFRKSKLNVNVTLDEGSSVLRYGINTDWQENGKQGDAIPTLRFRIPLAYTVKDYLYDIPFGTIERCDQLHDAPGHIFIYGIDENGGNGIAIFNDTQVAFRGADNSVNTTILRATSDPDDYPEFGKHYNQIGIAVLENNKNELFKAAHSFVYPMPFASVRPHKGTLPLSGSLIGIEGEVVVSAVKLPENNKANEMIIRFYSISEKDSECKLKFAKPVKSAEITNSLETTVSALKPTGNTLTIPAKALKPVSVKVIF